MYWNISQFPYYQLKTFVDDHDTLSFRIKRYCDLTIILFYLIRSILAALSYYSLVPISNFNQYDIIYSYLHHFNPKFYFQFIVYTIFNYTLGLFFQTFVYFRPVHSLTFQSQYDMIVRNHEYYKQSIHSSEEQQRLMMDDYQKTVTRMNVNRWLLFQPFVRWLIWQWTRIEFLFQFKHVDKSKMAHYKLRIMPSFPLNYRLKIILFNSIIKLIVKFIWIIISKIFVKLN